MDSAQGRPNFVSMKWLLLVMMLGPFSDLDHKFYVGLTDIHYDTEESTLEISHRYFLDDFSLALEKRVDSTVVIDTDMDPTVLPLVEDYLLENFLLSHADELIPLSFLGYELQADVIWCYMQAEVRSTVDILSVENRVLMDVYESQKNLVHFSRGKGDIQSIYLNSEEPQGRFH